MVVTTINDGTFNDHRRPHFCGRCLHLTTTFWLLTTTYPIVDTHFSCSGLLCLARGRDATRLERGTGSGEGAERWFSGGFWLGLVKVGLLDSG